MTWFPQTGESLGSHRLITKAFATIGDMNPVTTLKRTGGKRKKSVSCAVPGRVSKEEGALRRTDILEGDVDFFRSGDQKCAILCSLSLCNDLLTILAFVFTLNLPVSLFYVVAIYYASLGLYMILKLRRN